MLRRITPPLALMIWLLLQSPLALRAADEAVRVAPPPPVEVATGNTAEKMIVLVTYCIAIMAGSLAGGYLPSLIELTHTRMQTTISFVGGLMLGIGVFHLLPHSVYETGSIDVTSLWMMGGMLLMFFLLRTFHFHQHDIVIVDPEADAKDSENPVAVPVHDHDCGHDHDDGHHHPGHEHGHQHHGGHAHKLSWLGITIGLCVHTLIDGIALGAAVEADAGLQLPFSLFGVGTFLAILFHKPLDALSITGLMIAGGWSATSRNLVNLGFACMCPIGAALFLFGIHQISGNSAVVLGAVLAASAGIFICIALSDLLPEMEFHSHNRMRLSIALLLGIMLAWGLGFLEPEHVHGGHVH